MKFNVTGQCHAPDLSCGGNESSGIAINSVGYTTGYAAYGSTPVDPTTSSTGPPHAFLNDAQGLHDLGTLGGLTSIGNGINANSEVVGFSYLTGDKVRHAFLYTAGVMLDLKQLVSSSPLAPFVTLTDATGIINDSAWIIANGVDSRTGDTHGYLLQPITRQAVMRPLRSHSISHCNEAGGRGHACEILRFQGVTGPRETVRRSHRC